MKFLGYITRNARRNPVRTALTVASVSVCGALLVGLLSFMRINTEVSESTRIHNRVVTMSSQGFSQPVPIVRVREVAAVDGVVAATPFAWFGGKYADDPMPFAQFAVDADSAFKVMDEYTLPPDQLRAFREDKAGCVVGRKLAEDKGLKVGSPLPLKGDIYPVNLDMTVRGIYDAPSNRDRRMLFFRYDYLDDLLKRAASGAAGNAGMIFAKCRTADAMPEVCRKIDAMYANSSSPTKTQSEEAFGKMFAEMIGDLQVLISAVGASVVLSLICVAGVAMAMAMRERTTEIAVLKAIGFRKGQVLYLVLAESVLVAGMGGVLGALGFKFLCDAVDLSKYSGGTLPFFYISWPTALVGLGASVAVGLISGVVPAFRAAWLSVIDGLRRVV